MLELSKSASKSVKLQNPLVLLENKYNAFGPDIYQFITKLVLLRNEDLLKAFKSIFKQASEDELQKAVSYLNKENAEKMKFTQLLETFA